MDEPASTAIKNNEAIERIFKGIRPVVVALIAVPACNMLIKAGLKLKPLAIAITATLAICLLNVSPVIVMIAAGVIGVLSSMYSQNAKQQ